MALALGSGGARGYAHIGVIDALTERGVELVAIAGSSMGALVGGVHAAGALDEFRDWAVDLHQLDVLRLLDLSLSAPGAIRAEKIFSRVRELVAGAQIEDLPVAFTAVATDLLTRREVWFQRGPLDMALRASIAIPTIVTPIMLNGRLLADGGLTNPVPIAPTSAVHADLTVAVSLAGEPQDAQVGDGPPEQATAEERPVEEWGDRFRRSAASLLDRDMIRSVLGRFGGGEDVDAGSGRRDGEVGDEGADPEPAVVVEGGLHALPEGLGKLDVMTQSIDAMQAVLTRYRLAGYPPDVLVSIPKDACRSLDFHRASDMIELGHTLAVRTLDAAGLVVPATPDRAAAPDGANALPTAEPTAADRAGMEGNEEPTA